MSYKRLTLGLSLAVALGYASALAADDLDALAGKWSVKKTNDQGETYTQTLSIKGNKFIFQIVGAEDRVRLYAEGELKLDQLGPFHAAHFIHIRGGASPSELDDVDDEYVSVYRLDGDSWMMASNFDKERERQKPSLDVYQRVKSDSAPASPSR